MTLEELQEQVLKMTENLNSLKIDNEKLKEEKEQAEKRQKELEEHNQKLFLRVTTQTETKEEKEEKDIPTFLDKNTYDLLDKFDIKTLNDLLDNEEEE